MVKLLFRSGGYHMIHSRAVANYYFLIKSSGGISVLAIFPLGEMLFLSDFFLNSFISRAELKHSFALSEIYLPL